MECWDVVKAKASPTDFARVLQLVEWANGLLTATRDTFPTYTLHDGTHAKNVIRQMERLLGERIADLSGLEAAMLILSAYFHDLGMVYSSDERSRIEASEGFDRFLRQRPSEYLRYRSEGFEAVVNEYCRWDHADRVRTRLADIDPKLLIWGHTNIEHYLAELCRSHDRPVSYLRDTVFEEDFLGSCDLRFCALLLRTADLLDFDDSRTPRALYEYLGLKDGASERLAISNREWKKHMHSDGYRFPDQRYPSYEIGFFAGPDDPEVDFEIRRFLDYTVQELNASQREVRHCQSRWQGFEFPGRINRAGIISNGYALEDLRIQLDHEAVSKLFMGENLYDDPRVFLRELLQNAFDATRARLALDPGLSKESLPVAVTSWVDRDGCQWIRVDDKGIGMDVARLRDFFLRVGASYYESADFRAQLARTPHARSTFTSGGRFGIGVLSSFLIADRLELSTRSTDGDPALRLQFRPQSEYFVLQNSSQQHSAHPMPSASGVETGYRPFQASGTSIAVRLDPRRGDEEIDAEALCRSFITLSDIPITVDGKAIPQGEEPLLDAPITLPFSVISATEYPVLDRTLSSVELRLVPLEFGGVHPELNGKGFAAILHAGGFLDAVESLRLADLPWSEIKRSASQRPMSEADLGPRLSREIEFGRDGRSIEATLTVEPASPWIENIHGALDRRLRIQARLRAEIPTGARSVFGVVDWAHNGVRLPRSSRTGEPWARSGDGRSTVWIYARIALSDSLRPDLDVTRQEVRGLSPALKSALTLSLRTAAASAVPAGTPITSHPRVVTEKPKSNWSLGLDAIPGGMSQDSPRPSLGVLLEDILLSHPSRWSSEPLFRKFDSDELISAVEMSKAIARKAKLTIWRGAGLEPFLADIANATLQSCFNVVLLENGQYEVLSERTEAPSAQALDLRPMFLVPYGSKNILLRLRSHPLRRNVDIDQFNEDHPFAQWLLVVNDACRVRAPELSLIRLRDQMRKSLAELANNDDASGVAVDVIQKYVRRVQIRLREGIPTPPPIQSSMIRSTHSSLSWAVSRVSVMGRIVRFDRTAWPHTVIVEETADNR